MSAGYIVLPLIYDRWQRTYGKDYSTLILPRLLATVESCRLTPSTMLDVACGTGSLALMMARRDWRVWGVDASARMIAASRAKRAPAGRVKFLRQDMRDVKLDSRVMLATSMFDSLNHLLTEGELLKTFRSVRGCLETGGFFVFDLNNERCFKSLWTKNGATHHRDFTLVLENSYNPGLRLARSRVTLFLRHGRQYRRHTEAVWERCFTRREVARMLRKAGFRVRSYEEFSFTADPGLGPIKSWWVAEAVA